MIEESKTSPRLDNHADYIARNKFEIRQVEGKGRGLVAKEKIEAGELLIACKAFVFVLAKSEGFYRQVDPSGHMTDENDKVVVFEVSCIEPMVEKARNKLTNRPELAEEFYRLYAGPELGHLEKWTEGESSLIDMDRIDGIIRSNHFESIEIGKVHANMRSEPDNRGLWLIPSYINHSCVDTNCINYFAGDYMFIRATKSIEKDEEILVIYVSPVMPFAERQRVCRLFHFDCQCRLCAMDRQDPIEIKQRMEEMLEFVEELLERMKQRSNIPSDLPKSKKLLKELLKLRPQRDLNHLALRVQEIVASMSTNETETVRSMTEYFEIHKSNGEFLVALTALKHLRLTSERLGDNEQEKWKMEARQIAKLIYGDERMADLYVG